MSKGKLKLVTQSTDTFDLCAHLSKNPTLPLIAHIPHYILSTCTVQTHCTVTVNKVIVYVSWPWLLMEAFPRENCSYLMVWHFHKSYSQYPWHDYIFHLFIFHCFHLILHFSVPVSQLLHSLLHMLSKATLNPLRHSYFTVHASGRCFVYLEFNRFQNSLANITSCCWFCYT